MESQPATMTKTSSARAMPLFHGLPEEIAIWEILVRLAPKFLLRCRAVCRTWRHATSTNDFLQAHHVCQPSLPIICGSEYGGACRKSIHAFDHRDAGTQLQPVARLDDSFSPEASCDGLLILYKRGSFSVCNPATLQHAPLLQLSGFSLLGMYRHCSTGEYRLLLHQSITENKIGCYCYALGSDQQPRYIGEVELAASGYLPQPVLVRNNLHWYPVHYRRGRQQHWIPSKVVIVFDTTSESFQEMRAPVVPAKSCIFEIDGTLGIYSYNNNMETVDIWILRNYKSEIWTYKYRVKLPAVEIKGRFGQLSYYWYVSVHSVDGDVLLLVTHGGCMFQVDTDGRLVGSFRRDGQQVYGCQLQLKQTLVSHTFFMALQGYDVNPSPFV